MMKDEHSSRTRPIFVGLACVPVLGLALAPSLLAGARVLEFDDVDFLYRDIANRIVRGQVPYRDFLFVYPIGCLPQLLLARLAGGDVLPYRIGYAAVMLAVNALLVGAVAREVGRVEGSEAVPRRLGWYLVCFLFLGRLIAWRLDVVPACLAFAAAAEWSRGRAVRGGTMAALGALVKLFPAMVVAPAAIREVGPDRGAPRGLIAFVAVFAAGMAIWAGVGGVGMLDSITYHAGRGLEIESAGAGVLMLAGRIGGTPPALETAYGSVEIDGPGTAAAVVVSRCVQAAAMAITLLAFARSGRSIVRGTGALILAAIATAPVLSPQFLIWALPFVLTLGGPGGRWARPLFAAAAAMTVAIYPAMFLGALLPMRLGAVLVLNLRNAILVALWAIAAFGRGDDDLG